MTKDQILESARQQGVDFINLQFADILGLVKAVTIPVSKLDEAIDHNVWFDGSSIEGFTRIFESDMFLKLDLETFAILPWQKNTARLICDVYLPDGQPFPGDPRQVLKLQLAEAKKLGYIYNVGPELEFFLFNKSDHGKIAAWPHDTAGYFDLSTDLAQAIRQEMTEALRGLNIDVETLHHEVAAGQHEIDFKYADALVTADRAVTFRYALKAIAQKHNLHVTFMPKPIEGINGSGMHVHQSLFDASSRNNAFFDASGKFHLSELALNFIAGQLKHAPGFAAVTNPLVNSYKRLVPGYEAPVYVAWGQTNRSALIRIPSFTAGREKAVRCELRCPDPAANPYLAFAVMLASGLDGIKSKLAPPESIEENIFKFSDEQAKQHNVGNLPENLRAAVQLLGQDEVVKNALGPHVYENFVAAKTAEWDSYKTFVSGWEQKKYLEIY
ncbi:MAG: type I glutamate--ammonia ligase [bacterium]|nr:type I glutamate--ammonia ligase [bacterium]